MKILKKGILPKTHQEYRGRCKVCGCEVSATKGDPDLKSGYSAMDAQHGFYVICPTEGCSRQIDMEEVLYRGSKV
jgi:hypothetical protein